MAFFYGPLVKTIYTQELELLAKSLLALSKDAVNFGYQEVAGKKELFGYLGAENGVSINISKLLTKADFTHIQLSDADSNAFQSDRDYREYYTYNRNEDDRFTSAEVYAIQDYTGIGYININRLLYKQGVEYNSWEKVDDSGIIKDPQFGSDLLKTIFISSGLNKIMPEPSDQPVLHTYRGEHSTTDNQIQERIESIQAPDSFTKTPAYLSTTSDERVAGDFSGNVMIKFEGVYGKKIEDVSIFSNEKEYLLQPAKIQWTSHTLKEEMTPNGKRTEHIFTAKVVNPLIQSEQEPNAEEIAEFKKIVEWAKNNKIDTSFITEHNKNQYILGEQPNKNAIDYGDDYDYDMFTPPDDPLQAAEQLAEWVSGIVL